MKEEQCNIFRISDGLGNQLFQYSCAYSMYKKTGKEIILDPMYSGNLRTYQLDYFSLDFNKRLVNKQLDYCLGMGERRSAKFKLWYRNLILKRKHCKIIRENGIEYDDTIYHKGEGNYYIGFWQSYKYFNEYYDDIKRQFVNKYPLSEQSIGYAKRMQGTQSVSLHIRRTDYNRTINNVCICSAFYKIALEELQKKLGDFSLFIFSDDKQYVMEHFKLHDFELVEGVSDLEEFQLMQCCKHHIIANSTFSWWAAYLSENKGGIVYAPIADMWTREFYLPEWNCVETQFIR